MMKWHDITLAQPTRKMLARYYDYYAFDIWVTGISDSLIVSKKKDERFLGDSDLHIT